MLFELNFLKSKPKEQRSVLRRTGKFLIDSDFNENTSESDINPEEKKQTPESEAGSSLFVMPISDLMAGKLFVTQPRESDSSEQSKVFEMALNDL